LNPDPIRIRIRIHNTVSKIKSHETEEITALLRVLFLLDNRGIRIRTNNERSGSVQVMRDPDPGGPKSYGSGSTTLLESFIDIIG
jgi:hypothetical protein